jgi:hypothetical protein
MEIMKHIFLLEVAYNEKTDLTDFWLEFVEACCVAFKISVAYFQLSSV